MQKKIIHICLALKMLLCVNFVFAQADEDSVLAVPKGKTRYTLIQQIDLNPEELFDRDTTFSGIQHKWNPGYQRNLGNLATPIFPLIWNPVERNGFTFGFNQWDVLRLTSEKMPLYNTQNPFTELEYTQGPEKLQTITALHTQNILPYWNAAVHLKREGSEGYYTQQNTRGGNFGFNTWYRSPNRRYMAAASIILNDFSLQENGGIQNDTLYEKPGISARERRGVAVNLTRAKQLFEDQEYSVKQFLYFGPKSIARAATDTDSVSITILKPRFYITHQLNYYTQEYYFEDLAPDSSFYKFFYYNNNETKDRYKYNSLSNKAGVGYFYADTVRKRNYGLQLFAKYAYINLSENALKRTFHNTSLGFEGVMGGRLRLNANGEVFMTGYNAGDFKLEGNIVSPFLSRFKFPVIAAYARLQQYEPDFIEQRFTGNHLWWDNNFNKSRSLFLSGSIFGKGLYPEITAAYAVVNNMVYFNDSAHPQQAAQDLHYIRFGLNKAFHLGRNFHFEHDISYQKQLQGNFIRIADWVIHTSYYYQGQWTRTLQGRIGFDFWYNSSYKGYGYMPSVSRFYVQDKVTIGNYPLFDVFVAGKLKRFMMYFKLEHVTQGLFGHKNYNVVHYPVNPFTFRFGLKWSFYN